MTSRGASNGGGSTISSMLDALDLVKTSEPKAGGSGAASAFSLKPVAVETSAAQQLMQHRALEKERRALAATMALPQKPVVRSNPLLDQISSSTTEAPTYWKYANNKSSSSKKVHKSSAAAGFVSKATALKRRKGESYRDRHETKGSKHVLKKAVKMLMKK